MKKKALAIFLAAVTVFGLCACGSSAKYSSATVTEEAAYDYAEAAAAEYYEGSGLSVSGVTNSVDSSAADSSDSAVIDTEKIIYSADASVETTEFDDCIEKLNSLIESYGGFIEQSSICGNNYSAISRGYSSLRYASYTIRIPSRHFNTLMSSLPTLGNVPYNNTYTENITTQYYDTQARLNAYKTQEQTLLSMLEKAETVEDLIAIEDKLTDVRYSIESLQSTLTNWDREVSYSTVNLSINEVTVYTPAQEPGFGEKVASAFKSGWKDAVQFLQDLFIWLLEVLPSVLFAVIIAAAIIVVILSIRRRAKKRRQQAKQDSNNRE